MLASMPAAARENKDALAQVDAMVGGMETTVELKADGAAHMHMKMSMMGREMNESADGSWKLDGGKLTIAMKKDGKDDTKVADFDGKSFSIEDDAGGQKMKMTFHRR